VSQAFAALSRAADRVYAKFGEAAVYADRSAATLPCTVLIDRDLTRYGAVAVVNQRTAVVQVRLSEVAAPPRRGETFTVTGSGQVLVVDSLQGSDEFEHRVFAA
jgi:hypothetical protein